MNREQTLDNLISENKQETKMPESKIYQIIHVYDVDGGFGDAVAQEDVLGVFTDKKQAEEYIAKWSRPHIYDRPYSDLECGRLVVKEMEINNLDINKNPFKGTCYDAPLKDEIKNDNIVYIGAFIEHDFYGKLKNSVFHQHVTLAYKPTEEQLDELRPYFGKEIEIEPVGYANNGRNEGIVVCVKDKVPYFGQEKTHITISIADGAKPVDTGKLNFFSSVPNEYNELITAKIGVFTKDKEYVFPIDKPKEIKQENFER